MLPSETMIWQPEFTDKTLSRKPGAVHAVRQQRSKALLKWSTKTGHRVRVFPVSIFRFVWG
ncbi:hypothetical protein C5K17_30590 [Shigella dysenteriae]|nr:hypothetical protein C5K17_30590 [Shigella dysenteriae]